MNLKNPRILAVLGVLLVGVVALSQAANMFVSVHIGAGIRNVPPKVIAIRVLQNGEGTRDLYPYTIYSVIVKVLDLNGYRDIQLVNLTLKFDDYSGSPIESDEYMFIWEKDYGAYEVGMTGHLLSCEAKKISRIILKLNFTIVLGLARMGDWKAIATPHDETIGFPKIKSLKVLFFGMITLYATDIYFWGYPNTTVSANRTINGTITANGPYQFLIKATNLTSEETDFVIPANYLMYNTINDTETALNITINYTEVPELSGDYVKDYYFELYIFLWIPPGTPDANYGGTIYIAIENE